MINALEFLFTVVVIGSSICLIGLIFWFVVDVIALWKIYVRGPVGGVVPKKQKKCKHSNSTYTEKHPDLVWECNDCGELHK